MSMVIAANIRRAVLCGVLLAASSPLVWGYAGDTHYYLRFASALETCFNWDEAHLIASADLMLDKNRSTVAEKHPFKKHNKVYWHAFSRNQERFNELWERVLAEKDPELKLIWLGQFMHVVGDWEPHFGWGIRLGHGITTLMANDPDSLGYDALNNQRMISQSLYHMLLVCVEWGREPESGNDPDRAIVDIYWDLIDDDSMQRLFETNTPRWKKWGKRWKTGKQILAENHLLVERLIERRANATPGRDIPDDFTPGDPERGIPPPIGLRLNQDGTVIEVLGVETQLSPEYDGSDMSMEEEEAYEEEEETDLVDDLEEEIQDGRDLDLFANVQLSLEDTDLREEGWLVDAVIENQGNGASEAGRIELVVLDVATEELLGEASRDIPSIRGGEKLAYGILVESGGDPTRRVLIGASTKINDLSADNNDVWFMPWRDEVAGLQKVKEKKKRKGKRGTGTGEFLGEPKVWIDDRGNTYLAISAYATGGDSSRRLGQLRVEIGESEMVVEDTEGVWFSVPDLRRRLVPARGIFLFTREEPICAEIEKGNRTVKLVIAGKDVEMASMTFDLDDRFIEDALAACAQSSPRRD
jgi:hypothetical protein